MKFREIFSSKKKDKLFSIDGGRSETSQQASNFQFRAPAYDLTARLPPPLLEKIFAFVCPHAHDETYESCEQSAVEDACMLCDLRDLAHCTKVSKRWSKLAGNVLYCSIRIDSVHYCEREEILAEKRKRRSFFDRNADPEDTAQQRLMLLCRTLREDNRGLTQVVQFFKVPYMTRETCKTDLARTVSVLPNLRFVDLPEGFFTGDMSSNTLRQELQARCPDIRKMTYMGGSERNLELLGHGGIWFNLEVLELNNIGLDSATLRHILGGLRRLHALKVTNMSMFDDDTFRPNPMLPPFPALTELLLEDTPQVTAAGLTAYLSDLIASAALLTLSLTNTGVSPSTLPQVLCKASGLIHLSIIEQVSTRFPLSTNYDLLASTSLKTLHYEITSASSVNKYADVTKSYYTYLTASLLANGLSCLRELYVRDPDFPESLLDFAPPRPAFVGDAPNTLNRPNSLASNGTRDDATKRFSSNNPFAAKGPTSNGPPPNGRLTQELEVYTKGLEEMEWNFARVEPASQPGRRGSMTALRPVSTYGLAAGGQMSPSWTGTFAGQGNVRRSVMVGNGFGGFLAVPADDMGRPSSSGNGTGKRGSSYDMWR